MEVVQYIGILVVVLGVIMFYCGFTDCKSGVCSFITMRMRWMWKENVPTGAKIYGVLMIIMGILMILQIIK